MAVRLLRRAGNGRAKSEDLAKTARTRDVDSARTERARLVFWRIGYCVLFVCLCVFIRLFVSLERSVRSNSDQTSHSDISTLDSVRLRRVHRAQTTVHTRTLHTEPKLALVSRWSMHLHPVRAPEGTLPLSSAAGAPSSSARLASPRAQTRCPSLIGFPRRHIRC